MENADLNGDASWTDPLQQRELLNSRVVHKLVHNPSFFRLLPVTYGAARIV
jgi:hypothetical protein